jgi:hypothetical protein
MIMRKYFLFASLVMLNLSAFAQAEFDALRFSQSDLIGTARFVGMSGAFGALGGDMSAININPAGIGVYRTSEFSFSPAFQNVVTSSNLNGSTSKGEKANILMNGFGYVGTFRTYDESAISNFNFAITYNRVADFNRNTNVVGRNRTTSLLDRICDVENSLWSNGTHPYFTDFYDFVDGVHVVGLNNAGDAYIPALADGELTNNDMQLQEKGGVNSWNFTLGANYSHNLYLGIGLGIQAIDYERSSIYWEEYELGGGTELRNALTTTGTGIDFKVGVIYRPAPELRLGVSFNSGTYYTMTDVYAASMGSFNFYSPDPLVEGPELYKDYMLKTPWKLTLSAAYQFDKKGLFSFDFDYIDYRNTSLKNGDGFERTDINNWIEQDFVRSFNFRIGGEIRLTENFSARMGAACYLSPVIKDLEYLVLGDIATPYTRPEYSIPRSTAYASLGVGYRSGAFFADVAVQEKFSHEHFYNYYEQSTTTDERFATLTRERSNLVLTTGFKF